MSFERVGLTFSANTMHISYRNILHMLSTQANMYMKFLFLNVYNNFKVFGHTLGH